MKELILTLMLLTPQLASTQSTAAGFTVSGRVARSAAVPSKAIERVALMDATTGATAGEAVIGADGSFRFLKIRPGTYAVQIPTASADWVADSAIIVVVDKDVSSITLTVSATVTISWKIVVDPDGLRPPVTMSLAQYRGGQGYRLISLTDAVTPRPVVEGEYRVSWTSLPAGYFIKSVTMGGTDVLTSPLKVTGGNTAEAVVTLGVVSPPPWVKVSGRVVSLTATPLPAGLRVALEDSGSRQRTSETPLGTDGSFEFPMVLPGTYRPMVSGASTIQVMGPTSVVVPNSDLASVQIAVASRKDVTGKVTVEGPPPLSPPTILLIVSNRTQSVVSLQPDGSFNVSLPVGNAPISVTVPGFTVRALTYGGRNLLAEPLRLGATDTAELRVTVAPTQDNSDLILLPRPGG